MLAKASTTLLLLALLLAAAPTQGWLVHTPTLLTRPARSLMRDFDTFSDLRKMMDDFVSDDILDFADALDAPEALLLRAPGSRRQLNNELALNKRRVGDIVPSSPSFDFIQTKDGEYLLTVSRVGQPYSHPLVTSLPKASGCSFCARMLGHWLEVQALTDKKFIPPLSVTNRLRPLA